MEENIRLGCYPVTDGVEIPVKGTDGAACFDIKANLHTDKLKGYNGSNKEVEFPVQYQLDSFEGEKFICLMPLARVLIPTGIIFQIPVGYSLRLHPRSGNSFKRGFSLANAEGIIDSDYYHETFVCVVNLSENILKIRDGEKIAQAELIKDVPVDIIKIKSKPGQTTDRTGGFGSTG
jgi:dUTP pyrophosphatase